VPLRSFAKMMVLRTLLVLFIACLWLGLWLWWQLVFLRSGLPPLEPGFLRWWSDLEGQPELDLFLLQLGYPVFWWFTRKPAWTGFWGWLRKAHLITVFGLVVLVFLMFLATPDVSGFRN